MKIKILCDKCFNDTLQEKTIYKYGSAVYCEKCYEQIEKEILEDMKNIYLQNQKIS